MATTPAQIANLALSRIGVKAFIDSLEEGTEEAAAVKAVYADVRDALLAIAHWPFATKRRVLALLSSVARTGWSYVYALPADCVEARYLWAGTRTPSEETKVPFEIEASDDLTSRVLVTDLEAAELIYTAGVTAVPLFPPLFVDVLAWRLAQELTLSLSVKPQLARIIDAKCEAALVRAKAAAFREGQLDAPRDSEFVRVRS